MADGGSPTRLAQGSAPPSTERAEAQTPAATPPQRVFQPTSEQRQSLAAYLEFLDDPEGRFEVEQVASGQAGDFAPLRADKPLGYGYPHKALWLRVALDFSRYPSSRGFLSYDYEHIGNLRLYRLTPQGVQTLELDEALPREGRPYRVREYLLPVELTGASTEVVYIRLAPHTRYVRADFSWSGTQGVVEAVHEHALIYGLFFGGLFVMWLYNITLYVHLRDRAYLYYVYYLGCFTALFFHVYGFSPFLLRLNPFWEQVFAACGYGAVHGMVLFTRQFLALKATAPWTDRYLRVFEWVLVAGACVAFFQPVGRPFVYLSYLLLVVVPAMVWAGVVRWNQGYTPARVFSLGWAIFGTALGLRAMQTVGLVPENIVTSHAVMVASVLEAIIFSIALAYRIKLMETQRNEALDRTARREREILESERSTLEQRVAERTQSLEASLDARRMMLANVSHELRSPVNALRLLLDASSLNPHQDMPQVVGNARAITTHMSQLVENLLLLDVEQPRTGGVGAGLVQDFDLGAEITATVQLLGPLRQGSLATLEVEAQACKGLSVRGDLTSLRRILINLLSNAFKFTGEGHVRLLAEVDAPAGQPVRLTLVVSDTGRGIPTHMHTQIFEAFVTSGPDAGHTGTGLGLALSLQLARHLGGSLRLVSSVQGQGSTFECQLPFERADPKVPEGAVAVSSTATACLNILLAEDCPITAEAVQVIVRQLHHHVVHVATFDELERTWRVSPSHFDVALIDHRLPGGQGLDLIKRLRQEHPTSTTRVVLMTADVTPELLASAQPLCSDIVTKPTTAAVLRQLLGQGPRPAPSPTSLLPYRSDHPFIDPGPLAMLKNAGAAHHTLVGLGERFSHTVQTQLDALVDRLHGLAASGAVLPHQELVDVAHRLRSACLTIGAVALAQEMQQWSQQGDSTTAAAHGLRVRQAFRATHEALATLLHTMKPLEG